MSNLVEGQLYCSPVVIRSKFKLDALANGLQSHLYSGQVPSTGWGSIADDASPLRKITAYRPQINAPKVLAASGGLPRRLKGRYYWDAADPATRKMYTRIGKTPGSPSEYHVFSAVDLVIGETAAPGQYAGIFTTRSQDEIARYVRDGLRNTFAAIDPASVVQMDNVQFVVDSDFYMWLVHRYNGIAQLSGDLKVEVVRTLSSEDGLKRPANLSSGAHVDRAAVATYVLEQSGKLGPSQFAVQYKPLDLTLEIDLHGDGSFQVVVGKSFYKNRIKRDLLGPSLVDDAIYEVLPALMSAYASDGAWPTPGRDDFLDKAKKVLRHHAR
ncbi:hypothetical protein AB0O58_21065 [Rhodococcus sp. NPDC080181]|uniref:hypothetical protein n=1 Tax=Rhodococcus sp. NPDC080181 TaxID=3155292 RepID=UPI00344EC2FE